MTESSEGHILLQQRMVLGINLQNFYPRDSKEVTAVWNINQGNTEEK